MSDVYLQFYDVAFDEMFQTAVSEPYASAAAFYGASEVYEIPTPWRKIRPSDRSKWSDNDSAPDPRLYEMSTERRRGAMLEWLHYHPNLAARSAA